MKNCDLAEYIRKSRFTEDKSKSHENNMRTVITFIPGKNGGHMPSSLGGRLTVVRQAGRQADEILADYKIFKIQNFNSKACLGCLNRFVVPIAL